MKKISLIAILLLPLLLFSFADKAEVSIPAPGKVKKIVIDAGHGGHDPGAVGKNHKESHLALAMALKLGEYINANLPDVEVIYTRKTDVFIELHRRARIANQNKADLFISIHCNATRKADPLGTETWVMGLNKSDANLEVAKKENASILLEADYSNQYDGFDPNSTEAYIIFSLYQNIFLDQSLNLAAKIQSQFEKRAGRVNRGVKQAGFLVLYQTTMPGVLVETGFISNPEEEAFMASESGQAIIASAIFRAIREYKNEVEGIKSGKEDSIIQPRVEEKKPQVTDASSVKIHAVTDTGQATNPGNNATLEKSSSGVCFRVQFASSATRKPLNSSDFKGMNEVREYFHDGLYKYTSGNETNRQDASRLLQSVRNSGFKDAFIVAFLNEQRISLTEADEIIKNQKK
jgi:N-acetylmuramoyl-L-alanine amidase